MSCLVQRIARIVGACDDQRFAPFVRVEGGVPGGDGVIAGAVVVDGMDRFEFPVQDCEGLGRVPSRSKLHRGLQFWRLLPDDVTHERGGHACGLQLVKRAPGFDRLCLPGVAKHHNARAVGLGHFHEPLHDPSGNHASLVDHKDRLCVQLETLLLTSFQHGRNRACLHVQFPQCLDLLAIGRHGLHCVARGLSGFLHLGQHMRLSRAGQALDPDEAVRCAEDQAGGLQLARF
ncbi:hypothetical protein D3C71_1375830 [compost metagenome]